LDAQAGAMQQATFKIAPGLREWMNTDDASGCLARIEADAGLMFIKVGRNDLKLVGDDKATQRAKMLLDVHQKHQVQIQNFQDMREKRLSALEKRRNRIEGTGYKHSIEIQIDPSFVRRVIGTKGETIRAVMQKYEVNIHIPDGDDSEPTRTVRIFGNSLENIEKARGEVEFIEEVYPEVIEPAMFNWIRGRGDKTIKLFKELTGIVYARLDRDSRQMIVCGTKNAVEEAMAMFETHMMYYPVFSQMDEEMEQLVCQLEEHGDYNARNDFWYRENDDDGYGGKSSASKGKSKGGKGKDKGSDNWRENQGDNWNNDWKDNWNDNGRGKGKGKGDGGWRNDWNEPRKNEKAEKNDWNSWKAESSKGEKGGKGKGGKSKGWDDEEEHRTVAERPAKGGKGGGKKGGGKTDSWRHEEEAWEEEEEEEPQPRGRGRGGRTGGRDRAAENEAEKEERAPANRRMGKKGIRS